MVLSQSHSSKRATVRAPVLFGILAVIVVCVAGFLMFRKKPEPPAPAPQPPTTSQQPQSVSTPPTPLPEPGPATAPAASQPAVTRTNAAAAAGGDATNRVAATRFTSQLIDSLTQIGLDGGPITPQKAAAWNTSLERLIKEGAVAVPAIRDFLERNVDLDLSALEGGGQLGHSTLRMAMLDALWQIGGEHALDLSVQTLRVASDPREIAALADYLEQQAPQQYRDLAIIATRESLAMASAGQLPGRDVAPLFNVLQRYGDQNVVPDLVNAVGQWKYYSAIALAQLPNDQGLPALLQMAQNPNSPSSSTRLVATEMLAQHVTQSQDALNVIYQQAQSGQLPNATWLTIASVLEGHQFQIGQVPPELQQPGASSNLKKFYLAYGEQNYYSAIPPEGWTEPEISSRIAIIDQLLTTKPSEMATRALMQARGSLANRLPQPGQ